jgi:AraC-like DNA-binding protein
MELLDKNFKEKKMVAEYAAELLVTPNYLNRIVKKNTGFSAGHQIRQRVVLEAKRMGRYSDAGMKEIAYNLGFLDTAHFSRFFKTFGGINFTEFKRGTLVVPLNVTLNRA